MTSSAQSISKEDEVTKRLLRFVVWQVELAKKDRKWKKTLKEKAEMFKVLDQ